MERTCHYLERVGLDHTKNKVVEDDDNRKALYARLLAELKDAKDPWAERVAGVAKQEYEMLSV